jgi:23S rRNA pseudouridine1911/1915/1917 synthase
VPSRTFVKKLIDAGSVVVDGSKVKAHYKVASGESIIVDFDDDAFAPIDIEPENIPLNIFYEDDVLIVINKPAGLLVHPTDAIFTGTMVNALLYHFKELSDLNTRMRPGIVHRLDQDTSGLILVAKDNRTHSLLAKQFARHTVRKKYLALVEGDVQFEEGIIDEPLGRHMLHRERRDVDYTSNGKDSLTFYKVLKRIKKATYLALYPKTGRTHQLRVHMNHIGHPILGDDKYGHHSTFHRLALHAQSIGFEHPLTRHFVEFSTRPPQEFLERLNS